MDWNDRVTVELSEYGHNVLRAWYEERGISVHYPPGTLKGDAFTETLFRLAYYFGNHLTSSTSYPFKDSEIRFPDDPADTLSPSDGTELVSARSLEEIEHLLTSVRMTDYSDPEHPAHVENLLIAIVSHLKGDEI